MRILCGQSFRRIVVGATFMVVLAAMSCCGPLQASDQQTRFFEQLRSRELYGLVERFCLEELSRPELLPHQRIELAYELSRTLSQHALVVPRDQQADLWERSTQILEQTRTHVGQHDRLLLLDLQAGFIACAQGQALHWELELTPDDTALRQKALGFLTNGIATLNGLEPTLRERIRGPVRKEILPRDKLTPPELRGLLGTLQFELGQAHFERAGMIEAGNAERFAAIDEAEKWTGLAMGSDRTSEFGLTCQILLAGCSRLKINAPRALRLLDQVDAATPSPAIADQALAERARVLLMQKQATDAAQLLTIALKNRQPQPGELVALRIQVLIELWRTATEKGSHALAKELDAALDEQLESLTATNPGYWPVYCEALISTARDARSLGVELAEQVRRAKGLYAAKQIPEAIAAYAAARRSAATSGKSDLAFDMAYTQGSIEIEAGRFEDAARSFLESVEFAPQNPRIADARFLAAYALGQVYYAQPAKANREAYITALQSQRQDYPEHPTFGEATWLLGQLEEKRLQNSVAIRLYQEVPAKHPRAAAAGAASARCYDLVVTRLRDLKQPTDKWEAEADARLTPLFPSESRRVNLTEDQATAGLHLSNIYLQSQNPAFDKADRLLEWITRSALAHRADTEKSGGKSRRQQVASTDGLRDPAEEEPRKNGPNQSGKSSAATVGRWRELERVATRLRVVSLAGQGRLPEAEQSLMELAGTSPGELLAIISGLSKLVAQAQDKPRHQLGELQLRAALKLVEQRAQLQPGDQKKLDQCLVEAYVAAGRYNEATEKYRVLIKTNPKDSAALSSLALLLMKFGQHARTEEAQGLWKKLEGLHKPGSNQWFDARLNVIQCDLIMNKADKALKLIKVTKVLYPDPKDNELKQRFDKLQKDCEAALKK